MLATTVARRLAVGAVLALTLSACDRVPVVLPKSHALVDCPAMAPRHPHGLVSRPQTAAAIGKAIYLGVTDRADRRYTKSTILVTEQGAAWRVAVMPKKGVYGGVHIFTIDRCTAAIGYENHE